MRNEVLPPNADILAIYTRDLARIPLLTPAEERELGARALAGDQEAQDHLVQANLRFVIRVAKKYQGHDVQMMDLIEAGNMGLMHAARKFDPAQGVRFISYAVFWIAQAIGKEIKTNSSVVAATPTQLVRLNRVRKLQAEAVQRLGRELTVAELMTVTGYTPARIEEAIHYRVTIKRLDEPVSHSNDNPTTTLAETISADDDLEEQERKEELQAQLSEILQALLQPRERKVIEMYYGFAGARPKSLTEIGAIEQVSRERARQLKERALRRLRDGIGNDPKMQRALAELFTTQAAVDERAVAREEAREQARAQAIEAAIAAEATAPQPSLTGAGAPIVCPAVAPIVADAPASKGPATAASPYREDAAAPATSESPYRDGSASSDETELFAPAPRAAIAAASRERPTGRRRTHKARYPQADLFQPA